MWQRHITGDLYEYLTGGLEEKDLRRLQEHLDRCPACSHELQAMQESLDLLPPRQSGFGGDQPDSYWDNFPLRAQNSLGSRNDRTMPRLPPSLGLFPAHRLGLGVSISLVVAGIVIGGWLVKVLRTEENPQQNADQLATVIDERTSMYFRRAHVLLTGIANRSDEGNPPDVSVERTISRELLDESRYLKAQRPQDFSASVVVDLEPILIELANTEQGNAEPAMKLVQDAIREHNVLFRVRMAQVALRSETQHNTDRR